MTVRQKRYTALKKAGLCVDCRKPARPGKVLCAECARQRIETKHFYLNLGFCPVCHKYPIYGDEKECPECRARRIKNNRLSTEKARAEGKDWADPRHGTERAKSRYRRLAEVGRCVKCGKLKPMPGKKMCGICAEKAAARQREYRRREKETAG